MADALWLAAQQYAAARRAGQEPPAGLPAETGPSAPRRSSEPSREEATDQRGEEHLGALPETGDRRHEEQRWPSLSPAFARPEYVSPIAPLPLVSVLEAPVAFSDLIDGVPPLLNRRDIARALRPLRRRVDSRRGEEELDDEATAERVAQDGLWLPEVRPVRERWLELDVVVDDSRFASLHRPMCDQLIDTIGTVGAFRVVRVHLLDTDVADPSALMLRGADPAGQARPAVSLANLGSLGRRLILVLTDGVGDAWHSAAVQRLMAVWARSCPVAIVNVLPRRQWRRTGITTRPAWLSTTEAGAGNRHYAVRYVESAAADDEPVRAPGEVCVPMVEIEPAQLSKWAGFVAAVRHRWFGAVAVCGADASGPHLRADEDRGIGAELLPAELVRRFRATATPTSFALAVHLAAVPLNIGVMRLVQRVMLPRSRPSDLSELIGSGLLRRVGRPGGRRRGPEPIDQVSYDFVDGVRPELLASGRRSETARVLTMLGVHLGDRVRLLRELVAMIRAPNDATPPALDAADIVFAEPALHALRALAGPYRRQAHELEAAVHRVRPPLTGKPNHRPEHDENRPGNDIDPDVNMGIRSAMDTHVDARPVAERPAPQPKVIPPGVGVTIRNIPPAPERPSNEPPPVWGNVPARNISFTGREDILADLHRRLSVGTTAVLPEALHGMGGVGKSQIAIEYVHRHTGDYDLIWWIPAERPGQIQQALVELAAQLDLKVSQEVNVAVPAVREALRLGRPYHNWLLVFDNAEQLEEVRGFFPTNGPGKILVTSRNQAWTSVASSLEVDVFKREESKALLNLRGPQLSDENADKLAAVLGDLPLAIEQAAVWLAETGMPVEEYLNLFQKNHHKATELLGDAAPTAYELPVAAAWNVSLDRLHESDPAALQLLQVCAFFAPEPISRRLLSGARNVDGPPELLEALGDPVRLGRAMRSINQYALAKISHRTGTITLHRLVQRVLVGQLTAQEVAEFRHCGHQLLTKADPDNPDLRTQWPQYAELLPHVLYSGVIDCDDKWARQLVLNQIDFLFSWGDHQGFLDLAQQAVDAWTAKLGAEHEQTLSAGLRLGRALRILGRFQEAYTHHVHVRDLLAEQLGMEDEKTLEAQTYVGADLRYLGRFGDALELDRASFEVMQRRFGANDPLTLDQAHLYAIDLRLTGNPAAARELDQQTYQNKIRDLGEDHISTLSTLVALAIDEMERGRYSEARDLVAQAEGWYRLRYGADHPGAIESLSILSVVERKIGEHQRALELSEKALASYRRRYGESHPGALASALNHAINLRQTGDLDGSIELAMEAGRQYEAIFGPDHPNTSSARVNLAVTLRLNDQAAEALEMDQAALRKLTEVLGEDHPRSLVCAINLASDLFALGRVAEALELDRMNIERARRTLGEDHPTTVACSLNYSLDLRAAGEEAEAKALFADALARYRDVLGDSHPGTIAAGQSVRADCDIYPIPV
ncbi:FxSxx-COOH system tetratricopeptide repeat protein [Actinomadura scrupuli]|uniref:FxSxx-COOH system tetratricopeptide repeat protein n=1 Tax=Actinomadura scrupuli TaxID=559629 RepID=UPI003D96B0C2